MSLDYATLARIEDHLRRIADALERAHPKFNPGGYVGGDYTIPEMPVRGGERVVTRDEIQSTMKARAFYSVREAYDWLTAADAKPCSDRTCTDRDHWAPFGRVNHGDAPTTCIYGQDHSDVVGCVYRCAATMPGHRCTRAEHADDRHQWTMTDEEYDRRREEAGVPREVFDDVRAWADGREAAQRRLTAGCGDRGGECGQLDGSGAAGLNLNVQTALADIMTAIETGCGMVTYSLRPQSNAQQTVDAMHAAVALLREAVMRYTGPTVTVDARSLETGEPVPVSVTVRKVADPLDEDDHRPRHDRCGRHITRWPTGCWHTDYVTRCPGGCITAKLVSWESEFGPLTFCDCEGQR